MACVFAEVVAAGLLRFVAAENVRDDAQRKEVEVDRERRELVVATRWMLLLFVHRRF